MKRLADQITADSPELERLSKELKRAYAEFKQNPSEVTAKRAGDALLALGAHCNKMNAYMKPALEIIEMMAGRHD